MGEEAEVRASERAATEDNGADGAGSLRVGDAHVAAGRRFVDGHFGNDGYAHACADHAEETAELAAFEDNLWMKTGAIAGGDGGVTKAVAVAEEEERFGAQIFQRKSAAGGEFVFPG